MCEYKRQKLDCLHGLLDKWRNDFINQKFPKCQQFRKSLHENVYRPFFYHLLEKAMARHSSTLAWKIPWTEEPGGLQSMGSLRVGHDWLYFHFSLSCTGEGNGNPLQCSCLENPRDGGGWWAAVYGVAQSRTRLKRLSSSSSMLYIEWLCMCTCACIEHRTKLLGFTSYYSIRLVWGFSLSRSRKGSLLINWFFSAQSLGLPWCLRG